MKKAEKPLFVENLTQELKSASSVVLVDYTGLTVKQQQELKKRLKKVNAKMSIVKNTLLGRAGKEAKVSEDMLSDTVLSGPTAIILTEADSVAPLQEIYKFAKEFEIPHFKVGLVEGKLQDKEALIKLAQLPSKEVLFGQVVGTVASPMYGLVGTLQGNLQRLVHILNLKTQNHN